MPPSPRSLDAVVTAGTTSAGSLLLLTRPALRLGLFAMERFHHTVRHWSRLREFAADAAGATVTTADAAGRALDKLWNRTLTFLFGAVLILGFVLLPVVAFVRNRRAPRAG